MARAETEVPLPGGNVGGAVRVGDTVRRPTGPWTPAVHALLDFLATRLPHVPRVLGTDEQGREVLSYLPGRVIDVENEMLTAAQIDSLVRWTRSFHDVVTGFSHPGPWRYFPVAQPTMIGHNDIAPYNVCFDGDDLAGVFAWDPSRPTTALLEPPFIAWTCVTRYSDTATEKAAARTRVNAAAYG